MGGVFAYGIMLSLFTRSAGSNQLCLCGWHARIVSILSEQVFVEATALSYSIYQVLDEPAADQSDATVLELQLRAISKKQHGDVAVRFLE